MAPGAGSDHVAKCDSVVPDLCPQYPPVSIVTCESPAVFLQSSLKALLTLNMPVLPTDPSPTLQSSQISVLRAFLVVCVNICGLDSVAALCRQAVPPALSLPDVDTKHGDVGQVGEGRAESSYLLTTIQPFPFFSEALSLRRWSWGRECGRKSP